MRRHYLDNIRWITIICVVIYHVIYMFNGEATAGVIGPFTDVQYQDALQYILYPWMMILLFIVAGMCSRYYLENHSIKEFIKSRTAKLLVPSTIGLFVFQWIQGYFNIQLSTRLENINVPKLMLYPIMAISGTGVLWFVQLLWLFSMILALIRHFERGKLYEFCKNANILVVLLLVIPVYASSFILNTPSIIGFNIYLSIIFRLLCPILKLNVGDMVEVLKVRSNHYEVVICGAGAYQQVELPYHAPIVFE